MLCIGSRSLDRLLDGFCVRPSRDNLVAVGLLAWWQAAVRCSTPLSSTVACLNCLAPGIGRIAGRVMCAYQASADNMNSTLPVSAMPHQGEISHNLDKDSANAKDPHGGGRSVRPETSRATDRRSP